MKIEFSKIVKLFFLLAFLATNCHSCHGQQNMDRKMSQWKRSLVFQLILLTTMN